MTAKHTPHSEQDDVFEMAIAISRFIDEQGSAKNRHVIPALITLAAMGAAKSGIDCRELATRLFCEVWQDCADKTAARNKVH